MLLAESVRIIFALIAVLGFIGLAAVLVRKAGLISASSGFVRKKRLALVETLAVDAETIHGARIGRERQYGDGSRLRCRTVHSWNAPH